MQGWITERLNFVKARAIMVIALFTISVTVGCSAPSATETDQFTSTAQQAAEKISISPVSSPSATFAPTMAPQASTPVKTSTPTTISPNSSTNPDGEIEPFKPTIGGSDKIAFVEGNEIWMANLDGSALTIITQESDPISSLHWSPDGNTLFYISGQCIKFIEHETILSETITCFEAGQDLYSFQVSPDGSQAAISVNYELYVIPLDASTLSQVSSSADLAKLGSCTSLSPYKHRQSMVRVKHAYWSDDGKRIAILRQGFEDGKEIELIHLLDISRCVSPLPRLDEFPATRIDMENYEKNPILQDFAWDGGDLFALTDFKRNDGFGDLWIYSTHLHRGFKVNPISGKCCYRDPVFSADGKYLAFIFQDAGLAADQSAVIYMIPFVAIDSSLVVPPLALPEELFSELRTKPQPALRPVPEGD